MQKYGFILCSFSAVPGPYLCARKSLCVITIRETSLYQYAFCILLDARYLSFIVKHTQTGRLRPSRRRIQLRGASAVIVCACANLRNLVSVKVRLHPPMHYSVTDKTVLQQRHRHLHRILVPRMRISPDDIVGSVSVSFPFHHYK